MLLFRHFHMLPVLQLSDLRNCVPLLLLPEPLHLFLSYLYQNIYHKLNTGNMPLFRLLHMLPVLQLLDHRNCGPLLQLPGLLRLFLFYLHQTVFYIPNTGNAPACRQHHMLQAFPVSDFHMCDQLSEQLSEPAKQVRISNSDCLQSDHFQYMLQFSLHL